MRALAILAVLLLTPFTDAIAQEPPPIHDFSQMEGGEPLWEAIGNPLGFGGFVGGGILVFLIILAVPAGRRRLFSVEPYGGRDVLEEVVKCILLGGLAGAAVWLCVGCAINIEYI